MVEILKQWPNVVSDFLIEIGTAAAVRLERDLGRLAKEGHSLRDITRQLREGIFELKTKHNRMEYRCLFIFFEHEIVILLCFKKKSQKAPGHLIEKAITRSKQLKNGSEKPVGYTTRH